jgi:hypothetical protein
VHLFACATAESLGRDLVGRDVNGTSASAFVGYKVEFLFAPHYQQDEEAAHMLIDCDSAIDLALADGQTPSQAVACAQEAFRKLINEWQFDTKKGRKGLVEFAREDLNALCLLPGPC